MVLLSALLPALTAACGSTVESSAGSTASTSGGDTTAGAGGASPTTSSNGVTTSATGGSGKSCGGFAGSTCAQDEFCEYSDNACGAADGSGTCVRRPEACDANLDPVCACDGKIYPNACSAAAAGVDVSMIGSCAVPKGQFACGPKFCVSGKQYCERALSDVGGVPDSYGCAALPTACGSAPSCACLAGVPCGGSCTAQPGGALSVTCPGG